MNIAEHFKIQQVERLDLSQYARVASGVTISTTLETLNRTSDNCAFVTQEGRLVGIFTDRDVLTKVVDKPDRWSDPIDSVMTRKPMSVEPTAAVMDALHLMNNHRFRNVPVLGGEGEIVGNLTHFSLMRLADTLIRNEAALEESEPTAQHSLLFVNLSGLMSAKPIVVTANATVREGIETMRIEDIGSVMVVDDRGSIIGVFSERDVLTKIACKTENLDAVTVGEHMSGDVIKLSPRDPIASALHHMAERNIRRLPLVSATDRPAGVVSFRDIAAYIETSFSI